MIWAQVLIVAWLLTLFGIHSRMVALLVALLVLAPIHEGVSPAMALRGLWGDPSITTLQLMLLSFVGGIPAALSHGWRAPAAIALFCMALYVSALGPWDIDLYRMGYQPATLVVALGIIALMAWWQRHGFCLWLLAIDLYAWHAGWLESPNLWDTLLDPLLMCAMLALALRNGYRAHQNRKKLPT